MIEAITGTGANRARVRCDAEGCGREDVVACDYERSPGNAWSPNIGQINKKMAGAGWALRKGAMLCPACEAGRKQDLARKVVAVKEESPSNVAAIREPTREQKRQIMDLLSACYDVDAGRFKGGDTDTTVAETIGGGIMPGWVAGIREEFFGPDGGNGEMEAILAEMQAWVKAREAEKLDATARLKDAESILRKMDEEIGKVTGFAKRVEAIQKAVGPRGMRA